MSASVACPGASRWPEAALREAARLLGLSLEGKRVLRIGHCAVIALPAHALVARIARPGIASERLEAEMRFGRFCHRAGLPVLAPADEISDRPIETMSASLSFWPYLESTGEDIDWGWLGDALRRIHRLGPDTDVNSLWNPLHMVEARIERYRLSPRADTRYVRLLATANDDAQQVLERACAERLSIVHGDPTNVIVTANGPVLIDFDLSGVGPPLWDLVSVAIRHRRFGLSLDHVEAAYDSYGCDPRGHLLFEDLLRVRELLDCSFALAASVSGGAAADDELEIRLRALRNRGDRSRWTPLASRSASARIGDC